MTVILFYHYYLIQTFIVHKVALGDALCCQAIFLNNTESPYLCRINTLWYYLFLWQALELKHMGNIMEKSWTKSPLCVYWREVAEEFWHIPHAVTVLWHLCFRYWDSMNGIKNVICQGPSFWLNIQHWNGSQIRIISIKKMDLKSMWEF